MGKEKKILIAVIVLLLIANALFVFKYISLQKSLQTTKAELAKYVFDDKVLNFTQLFIEKVLRAKQEVSFEERLLLEGRVRDLKDNAILDQWNKFVNSKTEAEAQEGVINLLSLLTQKALGK